MEIEWKSNWFSFLLLSSLFSIQGSKIAWSQRPALLPPIWSRTGEVTISIIKKLTCHAEGVWNVKAAGLPAPSTCFWGIQSVSAWWWLSVSFNLHYSGKKSLEGDREPSQGEGGGGEGGREGGGGIRVRERGCRWERRIKMREVDTQRGIRG